MKKYTKIKGQKIEIINHSFRADWLFEEMARKTVDEAKGTKDNLMYVYCLIKAKNKDFEYSFDEFIDLMDEDPEILKDIYTKIGIKEKKE